MKRAAQIPSIIKFIAIPALGFFLILLFIYLGLPLEAFQPKFESLLRNLTKAEKVQVEAFHPALSLGGPAIQAENVLIQWNQERQLSLQKLRIRPAWSLSWFRGNPALHLDLQSETLTLQGSFHSGKTPRIQAVLELPRVEAVPLPESLRWFELAGRAELEVDCTIAEKRALGEFDLKIQEGSLSREGLPIAIPFETLTAKISLTPDSFAEVASLKIQSEVLSGELQGTLESAPALFQASLQLSGNVSHADLVAKRLLEQWGVPLDDSGTADFTLTGTLKEPVFQPIH